ncbi:hypothetical protein [Novosphingobium colocasiae]|uniref:hypothetical protein n=1 Tax=Novosphingobium colocasiae TaxID=1256513 RepID=UPI0035B1733E
MKFAHTLALAGLIAAASAPAAASDTIRHMKGHGALPAPSSVVAKGPKAACHPDPVKSRACRHHQAKAEEARAQRAEAAVPALADAAPTR